MSKNPTVEVRIVRALWPTLSWSATKDDPAQAALFPSAPARASWPTPGIGVKAASSLTVADNCYSPDDHWFSFWVADCFDPSIHIIRAPSFESAYEVFCEQEADRGHYLIKDGDPDYTDDAGHFTDDGRRVDSESFQGAQLPSPVLTVEASS